MKRRTKPIRISDASAAGSADMFGRELTIEQDQQVSEVMRRHPILASRYMRAEVYYDLILPGKVAQAVAALRREDGDAGGNDAA
jgi:hypothetical protein